MELIVGAACGFFFSRQVAEKNRELFFAWQFDEGVPATRKNFPISGEGKLMSGLYHKLSCSSTYDHGFWESHAIGLNRERGILEYGTGPTIERPGMIFPFGWQ